MLVPVEILIAGTGLVTGLIGAYVGLKNRVLLAEVRKEAAELETRMIIRISDIECRLQEERIRELVSKLPPDAQRV